MDLNIELIADIRFYITYLWSFYSLIYIYDFRSEVPAIPPPLIVKFNLVSEASTWRETFCAQVASYRDGVRSGRLMRQAARIGNKGRTNRLTNPPWALCHPTQGSRAPPHPHHSRQCSQGFHLNTHQAAGKASTPDHRNQPQSSPIQCASSECSVEVWSTQVPHLIPRINPKTPPFNLSVLKWWDKLSSHSSFPSSFLFPHLPNFCLFFKQSDILGKD